MIIDIDISQMVIKALMPKEHSLHSKFEELKASTLYLFTIIIIFITEYNLHELCHRFQES